MARQRSFDERLAAERRGRRGETLAAWWLRLHGWRVLKRRVRTPRGEIDLIARRGRTVAFVEVKWRRNADELDTAIDARILTRVAAAAETLAPGYIAKGLDVRIDAILLAPGRWPRHLTNIWQ